MDTPTKPNIAPFKCPVCNGFGTISFKKVTCHACKGKGYVVINLDRQREYVDPNSTHGDMAR